jgi:hypothetical protein
MPAGHADTARLKVRSSAQPLGYPFHGMLGEPERMRFGGSQRMVLRWTQGMPFGGAPFDPDLTRTQGRQGGQSVGFGLGI